MTWLVDADVTKPVIPFGVVASGGAESAVNIGGQLYRVHEFTSNGTFTVSAGGDVEVFAVGGGGAGGIAQVSFTPSNDYLIATGGGGGGGVISCNITLSAGSHSVEVGAGSSPTTTPFRKGGNSKLSIGGSDLVVAYGGFNAAGMQIIEDKSFPGDPDIVSIAGGQGLSSTNIGGSTGGGAYCRIQSFPRSGIETASTSETIGQGNIGGNPFVFFLDLASGGGGGGALSRGVQGGNDTPANGGNGATSFIAGVPKTFGAGGGSGSYNLPRAFGGVSGAGDGATETNSATNGQANTGGGGGGAIATETITDKATAGSGGSGIVIIRYPIEG